MKFIQPFPVLSTNRLTLRSLTERDLDDLVEIVGFSKEHPTLEDAREVFEKSIRGFENGTAISWVLDHRGTFAGTIGFYRGFTDDCGEVGYVMKQSFKRMGLMKEALHAVVSFGFDRMELQRITAYTKAGNVGSVRLLHSCGFRSTNRFKDPYEIFELHADSAG